MKLILNLLLGATSVLAASRTSPPSGCVYVAKSGGQYTTVQAAVNSLSTTSNAAQCIFIDQGTYTEQVRQLPSFRGCPFLTPRPYIYRGLVSQELRIADTYALL